MTNLAIISGPFLAPKRLLKIDSEKMVETPYGKPSSGLLFGKIADKELIYLARHGESGHILPHRINYRANLWALKEAGIDTVISLACVAGIKAGISVGHLVIPDQIVDYTQEREFTYLTEKKGESPYVDFTHPYTEELRNVLISVARNQENEIHEGATYAVTQGPRLQSAAEVDKLERDGCDIVGMTAMPEAALARELNINYASIAFVINKASGRSDARVMTTVDIQNVIAEHRESLRNYVAACIEQLQEL